MAITELTRGHVKVKVGDKFATVQCEMLIPTPELADFLVHRNSIRCWDPPFSDEFVEETIKDEIVKEVCEHLHKTGRLPEVV